MSGLLKPKNYDWKDSNLALFGSDVEKQVKKESAEQEPAWRGAGTEVGLQIWRIVNFEVTPWDKKDYGKFYNGDSYIILNTYHPSADSEELKHDLHFWIGSRSTQDEYGTVAYKTVELDTYLDGKPVQHREVEGFESKLFLKHFPHGLTIMEGGADSGFHHVEPEKYEPRLFRFSGTKKNIVVREVPRSRERLVSEDVFILDLGLQLYQWNGKNCNKDERFKAMQYLNELKSERGNAEAETLDEADISGNHKFYEALTEDDREDEIAKGFIEAEKSSDQSPSLYKLISSSGGNMEYAKVKEGSVSKEDFETNVRSISQLYSHLVLEALTVVVVLVAAVLVAAVLVAAVLVAVVLVAVVLVVEVLVAAVLVAAVLVAAVLVAVVLVAVVLVVEVLMVMVLVAVVLVAVVLVVEVLVAAVLVVVVLVAVVLVAVVLVVEVLMVMVLEHRKMSLNTGYY